MAARLGPKIYRRSQQYRPQTKIAVTLPVSPYKFIVVRAGGGEFRAEDLVAWHGGP